MVPVRQRAGEGPAARAGPKEKRRYRLQLGRSRRTALAAYNNVCEGLVHYQPAHGEGHRAHRVLTDGTNADVKEKAFALFAA
jgi:hypothetical protein